MEKKKKKRDIISEPPPEIDMAEAGRLLAAMATIINNTLHNYWLSKSDARVASDGAYKLLAGILKNCDTIAFRMMDGALIINGVTLESMTREIKTFVEQLSQLDIDNFTILRGATEDEFSNLLEIMAANRGELNALGGFAGLLADLELTHVQTKKMIYKEISEGQVVIYEDDIGKGGTGGDDDGERVGNILAFLKGDAPAADSSVSDDIKEIASDAERMADLILQAADVRQNESDIDSGESLSGFVVGCLRRTYDEMTHDKSYKTKAGKKRVTKNLLLLEEEILSKMRAMSDEFNDGDLEAISEAAEEMTDEIQIDTLADEYIAKRTASDAIEEQMLDLIDKRGIDQAIDGGLEETMKDRGLGADGWQELVVKAKSRHEQESDTAGPGLGGGMGMDGIGNVMDVVGRLDVLLNHMEQQFEQADQKGRDENSKTLVNTLTAVNTNVRTIAENTGQKIQQLVESLVADESAIDAIEASARQSGADIRITRREALQSIATIVNELSEPLAMIQSSLNMIESVTMGKLSDSQSSILDVAKENTATIANLLKTLKKVSNVVDTAK